MDASPPQSSPIPSKALLSPRPNRHIAHPYPRSDKGECRPHSPSSLSKRFLSGEGEGEGAGELSRTEKSRQGNLGSHPASAGPHQYSLVSEVAHQLPTGRSPAALSRSPQSHSQPSQWQGGEQASFYQGGPRPHGEHPFPYDPLPFPYADAYMQRQQGGPHDLARSREPLPYNADPSRARDPRYRAAQYADRNQLAWPMYAGQNKACASPWGHPASPSPTWQRPTQLSPGIHWGVHQWDYARAAWQSGSPRPQPLAWEHANGSSRATTAGLPSTGNPTTVRNP